MNEVSLLSTLESYHQRGFNLIPLKPRSKMPLVKWKDYQLTAQDFTRYLSRDSNNEAENTARIFTYNRSWQRHLEGKLGLTPLMDNSYGGKEYEIEKKRIRPPRARVRLSIEARVKLVGHLHQSRNIASQNTKLQAKSEAEKQNKGNTINWRLRTTK